MGEFITKKDIDAAVKAIRGQTDFEPKIAMILGSGLGPLAEEVEAVATIETRTIPGWPHSTVEGHVGRLVFGDLEKKSVMILQGRAHFYEGHSMSSIGLPIRVMQTLGVEMLIVTNAAGAVNPDFEPGELMLITDHINLIGMAGQNPLRGPNLDEFGPRFPDMSQAYDRGYMKIARKVAEQDDIPMNEGVYICLAGPTFETPADLRFLHSIGVDAVGMSTVPEVTVARHGGTRVMGVSGISNKANLDGETVTTHEEVLEAGKVIVPRLTKLIRGVLQEL
ncbi:MAG: purine-nucleoside phosphorylase [Anaerolineales bacterium]|jgi:purine-nucleoside phosphorylase